MEPEYINDQDAIVYAAFDGRYELVKKLIENDAPINIQDENGETALIVAVEEGWFLIAELLIKKGADVNIEDKLGDTPLAIAKWKGYSGIVKLLEENGANTVSDECARKKQWDEIHDAFNIANFVKSLFKNKEKTK